jgi:cellulose synthase/poly-beta-1,6-N-acetylglucosamine synthase-like glycosyltransferase
MREFARCLLAAAVGLLALTGLPYLLFLGLYVLLRPGGSPAEKRPAEPSVSVVIPTYNEARIVESKLEEVVSLDYPMEKVEVVVADASDDDTAAVVRDFFADRETPSLTLLHDDERRGVAAALNDAVDVAGGEVIFRTDADSRLAADALRVATANLADPDVGAVTGRQAEVLGDSAVEGDYRDMIALIQGVESRLDSTFICHGPCFAFRRELFAPLAPDTIADDTAIGIGIRRAGKRVVMDPALRFTESGVSSFGKRRTRKDRRAMGLLQLLVRHRDALGRYGLYGRAVLPFNWWFMVASPWLFALGVVLASLAALVVAGPLGFVVPGGFAAFVWLGQRDALGPLQAPYAVVDSQVSLFVAAVRLLVEEGDGTWTIDRESREAFE